MEIVCMRWRWAGLALLSCVPLGARPGSSPVVSGASRLSPGLACVADSVRSVLDPLVGSGAIPGAAVAIFDTEGTRITSLGVVEVGGAPVTDSTAFHFGSNGKAVTATLGALLMRKGLLDLGDTIGASFGPDVRAEFRGVSLAELFLHRSGIAPYTDDRSWTVFESLGERFGPREGRRRFAVDVLSDPPEFEPGAGERYSNAGFVVGAALMEAATDRSFESLMTEYVFEGLELDGGFGLPGPEVGDVALGHSRAASGPATREDLPDTPVLRPAGDMWFRFDGYARFAQAHLRALNGLPTPFGEAPVARLHDARGRYAMGWGVQEYRGRELHLHLGGAGTFLALVALFPREGWGLSMAVNAGGGDTEEQLIAAFRAAASSRLACDRGEGR